jgi:TolA-binding protein
MEKRLKEKERRILQQDEKINDLQETAIAQMNKHQLELQTQKTNYEYQNTELKKRIDEVESNATTYKQ